MAEDIDTLEKQNLAPQVYNSASTIAVDTEVLGALVQELGIAPEVATQTSVLIDDRNHTSYRGSQMPKWLDRKLNGEQDYNAGEGSVVRVSSRFKGKDLAAEEMNKTLAHELEHVAQQARGDVGMKVGNGAIWGLAATGAGIGRELAKDRGLLAKVILPLGMAAVGHQIGYKLAPHERGARARAQEITTTAISRI